MQLVKKEGFLGECPCKGGRESWKHYVTEGITSCITMQLTGREECAVGISILMWGQCESGLCHAIAYGCVRRGSRRMCLRGVLSRRAHLGAVSVSEWLVSRECIWVCAPWE